MSQIPLNNLAESSDDQVLMPGIGRKRDAVAHIERVNDEGSDVLEAGGGEINLDDSQEPSAEIQD